MLKIACHVIAFVLALALAACTKPAADFIERAKARQTKGQDREAAIELRNALVAEPDSVEANVLLGGLLLKVGNPVDAQHILTKASKLGGAPAVVLPLLGEALLEMEKYADAIEALKAIDFNAERKVMAQLAVLRGRALLGQGSLLEARTQFQLATQDLPAEGTLGLIRLALVGNDHKGAESLLDGLLAADARNADAWVLRGELLRGDGKSNEALKAFRKATEIAPHHVVAILSEAIVCITLGDFEAARSAMTRAERISPLKPLMEFARALLAYKERRYEDSRAALQRLLEAVPANAPALLLAGSLNFATEQYELAQNAFTDYLKQDPGNLYARKMLGATLLAKDQAQLALDVLQAVVEKSTDPELLALAGRAHMTLGRLQKATSLLSRAVSLAPKDPELRTNFGLLHLVANRRVQAIAELEAAIRLGPNTARADHALTMMLLADKQFDRAERVAAAAQARLPKHPDGSMLLGTVKLARTNDAGARALFERSLVIDPDYLPAIEALADIERREGKPDALLGRLKQMLARNPKHVDALIVLAQLEMERGLGDRALSMAREVLAQKPRSLQALLTLTRMHLTANKPQEAIVSARRASELYPWDSRAVELLADAQMALGDTHAAMVTLNRLVAMRPGQADPQLRIASVHAALGDVRSAVSRVQGVLRTEPQNVFAQAMLAELFMGMDRMDEALALAARLQQSAPRNAVGFRLEGDILLAGGKSSQAAAVFRKADSIQPSGALRVRIHRAQSLAMGTAETSGLDDWLARHPVDDEVRLYLGDVQSDAGRYKEAIGHYRYLLERRPDDFRVLNNLAWALHRTGDTTALAYAQHAAKLRPKDGKVLDTLGSILLAQGRVAEAVQTLLKATHQAPEQAEIRLHLAQALVKVGDVERARKELAAVKISGAALQREVDALRTETTKSQ